VLGLACSVRDILAPVALKKKKSGAWFPSEPCTVLQTQGVRTLCLAFCLVSRAEK
jgi:hypothetical protein